MLVPTASYSIFQRSFPFYWRHMADCMHILWGLFVGTELMNFVRWWTVCTGWTALTDALNNIITSLELFRKRSCVARFYFHFCVCVWGSNGQLRCPRDDIRRAGRCFAMRTVARIANRNGCSNPVRSKHENEGQNLWWIFGKSVSTENGTSHRKLVKATKNRRRARGRKYVIAKSEQLNSFRGKYNHCAVRELKTGEIGNEVCRKSRPVHSWFGLLLAKYLWRGRSESPESITYGPPKPKSCH